MRFKYTKDLEQHTGPVIVAVSKKTTAKSLPLKWRAIFETVKKSDQLGNKAGDCCSTILPSKKGHQKLIFINLDEKSNDLEKIKALGAKSFVKLGEVAKTGAAVWFDNFDDEIIYKFIEGLCLRNYFDAKWKTGEAAAEAKKKYFSELILSVDFSTGLRKRLNEFLIVLEGIFLARDLVAKPPVELTPAKFADEIEALVKKSTKLKVNILGQKAIEKAGLNLLLAVNKGSDNEARLIVITLNPTVKDKPIALIGKSITFDSGGYNLKPSGSMETMHTDMAGAAAVLGAILTLAKLNEKKKVIAVIPATENLISGGAYKPSDIITSLSGKTVEIGNTDAEGRLILADAITYTKQNFDPKVIVDIATLTGAAVVALGERYAGIFSQKPELIDALQKASQDSGEKVWHLPLDDGFMDRMKSKVADYSNIAQGSPGAGASTAAAFLAHFATKVDWAHIDIAGPSHQTKDPEAWSPASGFTGFGVSLLTTLVQKYLN